jgi:putative ABC transport system ATP-binding protein
MRRQSATAHELAQVELLAGLPGETLTRLGERMERRDLAPGERVVTQGDEGDRFYVVLTGLLRAAQDERGDRAVLRPGAYFGEVALLMDVGRTASVDAMTPATVASCDRATFDQFLRPLFTS